MCEGVQKGTYSVPSLLRLGSKLLSLRISPRKGRDPSHNVRFRPEAGPPSSEICSALQIAHALQFRLEPLFVECVLLEFPAALYPEQEKIRGPIVVIGLRPAMAPSAYALQGTLLWFTYPSRKRLYHKLPK